MSDLGSDLGKLKISDVDSDEEVEDDIKPDDSASKISGASSTSTSQMKSKILEMAMAKIKELEERLASLESPAKRKKPSKIESDNVMAWSDKITLTGYFKLVGNKKNIFNSKWARMEYIKMLKNYFTASDLSKEFTFEDLFFEESDGTYPNFQALLDAVPIPWDFEGCNLIKYNLTSPFVKVADQPESPTAAMD
jgi:hypothetical protein